MYVQDYILNGRGHGPVSTRLEEMRFETGLLRPFIETDPNHPMRGRPCVIVNGPPKFNHDLGVEVPTRRQVLVSEMQRRGIHSPVFNATVLRKEEWIMYDQRVVLAARYRLRLWEDMKKAASFGGFNAMSKLILEHETSSDPGSAMVDMDGLSDGNTNDTPLYQLEGTPLQLTHSDFFFSQRFLSASRQSGTPVDTRMGEAAGRRVGESVEKVAIGNVPGFVYGGSSTMQGGYSRAAQAWGLTNFPKRQTYTTLTAPTAVGWGPTTTVNDTLAMRQRLINSKFYGPFTVYHSNDWDSYMDRDYILTGGNVATQTLRQRLEAIPDIGKGGVKRLDMLFSVVPTTNTASSVYTGPGGEGVSANPFTLIMVQMTAEVVQAVNGLDITTVQWEEKGGMKICFKVIAIQVPRMFADFYGNCGILHGTTS